MIKNILMVYFSFISAFLYSEMINLECSTKNSDRNLSFSLLLGTETEKAIQILKKGQLQMDLKISNKYFEVGQFIDATKEDLIPVMKINRKTLVVEYAKYMQLVEPISCTKL